MKSAKVEDFIKHLGWSFVNVFSRFDRELFEKLAVKQLYICLE